MTLIDVTRPRVPYAPVTSTVPRLRQLFEVGADRMLAPLGYQLHDKVLSERPEGFPGYLAEAQRLGLDVNDYEEQCLHWKLPLPILEQTLFPCVNESSAVCEVGPGTGRWSRVILRRIPQGELHLVDYSPWLARFLTAYFAAEPRVRTYTGDGVSLPLPGESVDAIFSANTFVELTLGVLDRYLRDFARVLKPGGHAIVDYVDPNTHEGWEQLVSQPLDMARVFTFHSGDVIDRVFERHALSVERRYQSGRSTFVVARKHVA
jgi:SAM-dependent methyltransferase